VTGKRVAVAATVHCRRAAVWAAASHHNTIVLCQFRVARWTWAGSAACYARRQPLCSAARRARRRRCGEGGTYAHPDASEPSGGFRQGCYFRKPGCVVGRNALIGAVLARRSAADILAAVIESIPIPVVELTTDAHAAGDRLMQEFSRPSSVRSDVPLHVERLPGFLCAPCEQCQVGVLVIDESDIAFRQSNLSHGRPFVCVAPAHMNLMSSFACEASRAPAAASFVFSRHSAGIFLTKPASRSASRAQCFAAIFPSQSLWSSRT